jgi:AbrB family looped-hinge helix DNA binding protein
MGSTIARMTSKGQLTVPKPIRDKLNVSAGDSLVFEDRQGEIIIRKQSAVDELWDRGLAATLGEWADELDDDL